MTPPHGLVEANEYPAEVLRLTGRRADEQASGSGSNPSPDTWSEEVRTGRFPGWLWIGPKDDPISVVRWESVGRERRKVQVYLDPSWRRVETLRALLRELTSLEGPPVAIVQLPGWTIPSSDLATVLEPEGYRHLRRFDMIYPLDRVLPAAPERAGIRPLAAGDVGAIGDLLADAYSDFPLDPTYFSPGVPIADECRTAAHELFGGKYGRWWASASVGVFAEGRWVAAVLVTDLNGPLLAEIVVAPSHRRRGLGRAVVRAALAALRSEGAPTPRLVVTAPNRRARALYESLGFTYVPLPEDNTWIDLARSGRSDLVDLLPSELGSTAGADPPDHGVPST
ncbi:MAG TPA: GNAT family N-acetyltransferase [Thermoplasmata archaeon]|nr:GNAT family N-acetyltransferase [Thermoplasmata archaeon]